MVYHHDKERIELPPQLTRIEMELPVGFQVLTAPAKEFKTINNSFSRVIRVMIDKPEDSVQYSLGWGRPLN